MKETIRERMEEQKTYHRYMRLMAGGICSLAATVLAIYVGGWMMLLEPIKLSFEAFLSGTLTYRGIFITAVKCILSATTGGAIWCSGYILHHKIIGHPEY